MRLNQLEQILIAAENFDLCFRAGLLSERPENVIRLITRRGQDRYRHRLQQRLQVLQIAHKFGRRFGPPRFVGGIGFMAKGRLARIEGHG